jgi:hypothetical protein
MEQRPEGFDVSIRLVEGGGKEFHVRPDETVGQLKTRAMHELGVHPAPGAVYWLFFNGQRLDDSVTLDAAQIRHEAVLILATEPQVG